MGSKKDQGKEEFRSLARWMEINPRWAKNPLMGAIEHKSVEQAVSLLMFPGVKWDFEQFDERGSSMLALSLERLWFEKETLSRRSRGAKYLERDDKLKAQGMEACAIEMLRLGADPLAKARQPAESWRRSDAKCALESALDCERTQFLRELKVKHPKKDWLKEALALRSDALERACSGEKGEELLEIFKSWGADFSGAKGARLLGYCANEKTARFLLNEGASAQQAMEKNGEEASAMERLSKASLGFEASKIAALVLRESAKALAKMNPGAPAPKADPAAIEAAFGALENGSGKSALKVMKAGGFSPDEQRSASGETFLALALKAKNFAAAEELIKSGADLEAIDNAGFPAFAWGFFSHDNWRDGKKAREQKERSQEAWLKRMEKEGKLNWRSKEGKSLFEELSNPKGGAKPMRVKHDFLPEIAQKASRPEQSMSVSMLGGARRLGLHHFFLKYLIEKNPEMNPWALGEDGRFELADFMMEDMDLSEPEKKDSHSHRWSHEEKFKESHWDCVVPKMLAGSVARNKLGQSFAHDLLARLAAQARNHKGHRLGLNFRTRAVEDVKGVFGWLEKRGLLGAGQMEAQKRPETEAAGEADCADAMAQCIMAIKHPRELYRGHHANPSEIESFAKRELAPMAESFRKISISAESLFWVYCAEEAQEAAGRSEEDALWKYCSEKALQTAQGLAEAKHVILAGKGDRAEKLNAARSRFCVDLCERILEGTAEAKSADERKMRL